MTTCLNMISSIAFFRLFKRHSSDLKDLLLYNAVGLRQFKREAINDFQLGYCVGALISRVRNEFANVDDDAEVVGKFWPFAKRNADVFDERVRNDTRKFQNPQFRKWKENEMLVHGRLSNLGIMDVAKYECFSGSDNQAAPPFRAENSFTVCSHSKEMNKVFLACYICTLENKLCWSISYNDHFFDHKFVDEFISLIKYLIDRLIV